MLNTSSSDGGKRTAAGSTGNEQGVYTTLRTRTVGDAYVDHEGIVVVRTLDTTMPEMVDALTVLDD